ncbi:MAG: F0F1 ATP synthase subunit B [Gemmatimonadetes bacterium]|nr:F0F1 ATP synthase subunit B [Gemmatimonadota bacterium]MYC72571.1 F0F1 ATP synthase subunit B [Gemmatimonadota bacterium]MYI62583.1 F0F1 ATP synthase subunit B [Gemmatimonadota bacterium]
MLLDPHVGLIIWTIITFLVVLFVLKKFAWPHLLAALDEREQRISDAISAAEQSRQEAEEVLREHRQKLAAADEEARQIVAEAREAGANVRQTIVSQAREEAERMLDQARTSIESEKRAAIAELRRETANLAVQAAGALIDANLDDEKNRGLVDDFIARIPESN